MKLWNSISYLENYTTLVVDMDLPQVRLEAGGSQVKKELHLVCDGNPPKALECIGTSLAAKLVRNPPAMQETPFHFFFFSVYHVILFIYLF